MFLKNWLVTGMTIAMAAGCGFSPGSFRLQQFWGQPGYPGGVPHRVIVDRDGFGRPCDFINPSYDPRRIAEENDVAFRLFGEATWRPKCVSRPWIAEENEEAYRPIGADIWRPRWRY